VAAVIAAVLVAGMWWVTRPDAGTDRPQSRAPVTTSDPATPVKEKTKKPKKKPRTFNSRKHTDLPRELTSLDIPGLPGGSLSGDVPPLDLRITLTSRSPIGIVGWTIPTSPNNSSGRTTVSGGSWSLSTVVYGRPDY